MQDSSGSMLRAWEDAPAFLLSCPGPLRRHRAAVAPVSEFLPTQCLLGYEAQLLAFVAANPTLADRLFFAPLPEIFAAPESYGGHLAQLLPGDGRQRAVHLRFGGTRTARVLKEARNGLVLAEDHRALPVTASRHPFASGLVVPAAVRRVFTYAARVSVPQRAGGGEMAVTMLPAQCVTADLAEAVEGWAGSAAVDEGENVGGGLDVVSLAEFRSNAWLAGPLRARSPHLRAALGGQAQDGGPFVLVPWNLDHPGSVVPALLGRLGRLQDAGRPGVRPLLLPFNYPGQTGLIRRAIRRIRDAAARPEVLAAMFVGRLTQLSGLAALRRLTLAAWVDGNDPEHRWTMRRLNGAGFSPILLDPDLVALDGRETEMRMPAAELFLVQAETREGSLAYASRLPSVRALPDLLALTHRVAEAEAIPGVASTGAGRRARVAAESASALVAEV